MWRCISRLDISDLPLAPFPRALRGSAKRFAPANRFLGAKSDTLSETELENREPRTENCL